MGRLSNVRMVDPVLTNLAVGYTNAEFVGEWLMPYVGVDKMANKIPVFGKEAFKIYNTERALRAMSNEIAPEGITMLDLLTDEHDLAYPIDYLEDAEAAFPLESHGSMVTKSGIELRREKLIADMAQNLANYPVGNKRTLTGADQFTNPAADIPGIVEDGKLAVRAKTGKEPNTMIIGATSLPKMKFHASLIDKIKYVQKGKVSLEAMREIFEIENLVVGKAIYSTDTNTFVDIWGDNIVMAYVAPKPTGEGAERSLYEPSFGYTPRRKGGFFVDKYLKEGNKVEMVRSTDNYRPYIVSGEAGYLIKDTNA